MKALNSTWIGSEDLVFRGCLSPWLCYSRLLLLPLCGYLLQVALCQLHVCTFSPLLDTNGLSLWGRKQVSLSVNLHWGAAIKGTRKGGFRILGRILCRALRPGKVLIQADIKMRCLGIPRSWSWTLTRAHSSHLSPVVGRRCGTRSPPQHRDPIPQAGCLPATAAATFTHTGSGGQLHSTLL